jgi:tetratricopeptide (TPR) repeat protein
MTEAPTQPVADMPAPGKPRRNWRPYLVSAAAVVGAFLVLRGGLGYWYQFTMPAPPMSVLTDTDPAVARAIKAARIQVDRNRGSADAWGHLGKVLRAHEFEADSNFCFRQAEKLNPSDPRWPYLLGRSLRASDPDEAMACLQRSVRHSRSGISPSMLLGELLMDRGRLDEAEVQFRFVVDHDRDNPRASLGLGRIAFSRNQLEQSRDYLVRAAANAPKTKMIHASLAQLYSRLGDSKAAAAELRLVESLKDDFSWPDPYMDEVLALWVGLKARLTIASGLWKDGLRHKAIEYMQALARDYPESNKAQFILGDKLNLLERYQEAEAFLRAAVRLDPSFSRAHFELAYSLHQQGRIQEAAACYREAIRLQPDYAIAYYDLSFCLEVQGDRPRAMQALRDAIRYNPNVAKAYRQLGKLLTKDGQHTEALVVLRHALELAPDDQEATKLFGEALMHSAFWALWPLTCVP